MVLSWAWIVLPFVGQTTFFLGGESWDREEGGGKEGRTWNMIDDYFMVLLDPLIHVKYMSNMST